MCCFFHWAIASPGNGGILIPQILKWQIALANEVLYHSEVAFCSARTRLLSKTRFHPRGGQAGRDGMALGFSPCLWSQFRIGASNVEADDSPRRAQHGGRVPTETGVQSRMRRLHQSGRFFWPSAVVRCYSVDSERVDGSADFGNCDQESACTASASQVRSKLPPYWFLHFASVQSLSSLCSVSLGMTWISSFTIIRRDFGRQFNGILERG